MYYVVKTLVELYIFGTRTRFFLSSFSPASPSIQIINFATKFTKFDEFHVKYDSSREAQTTS